MYSLVLKLCKIYLPSKIETNSHSTFLQSYLINIAVNFWKFASLVIFLNRLITKYSLIVCTIKFHSKAIIFLKGGFHKIVFIFSLFSPHLNYLFDYCLSDIDSQHLILAKIMSFLRCGKHSKSQIFNYLELEWSLSSISITIFIFSLTNY